MSTDELRDTIVLAEDSSPNRKILAHLLVKMGFEVAAYDNGQDAWNALHEGKHERVVLVISDIMMPTMDGIQLLSNVRKDERFAKLPFVLVTAVSEKEYIMQSKELGANGYILKPVTFKRVTEKLQEIFPQRTFPKIAG